jgi:hypothetical protein
VSEKVEPGVLYLLPQETCKIVGACRNTSFHRKFVKIGVPVSRKAWKDGRTHFYRDFVK